MKALILVICLGVLFKANAQDKFVSKDVIASATEILWYNCDNGEGILYAEFEAFLKLKNTLEKIVSSEAVGKHNTLDPNADYSFLYFKVDEPESRWRVAALLDDTLIMGGLIYTFDKSIMDNWRYHNDRRISFNEAVKWVMREMDDDSLNYCGVKKRALTDQTSGVQ